MAEFIGQRPKEREREDSHRLDKEKDCVFKSGAGKGGFGPCTGFGFGTPVVSYAPRPILTWDSKVLKNKVTDRVD